MDTSERTSSEVPHLGANDRDLEAGQKVGEYVVEEKIGEGGFGTVFRAVHPLIGKLAAVKVLNRQYSAQPEMVSRFVAEARAVNQIRHRNIIDIFAFGQLEDGRHYYTMELLDGLPLDEHINRTGPMPLAEAIPVLRAVAKALDAAHAKGIAHRDLKPENIFLSRDSDGTTFPKLLDFGIAKLVGTAGGGAMHKTRTGAPIGTPHYMSPEQCRGRDVDHRTDIYAFGVVAFKVLTGEVPFDGEDYMEILLKQMGEEPPLPSARNPALPASVDHGIAWMLKKDPAERPATLVAAVRALEDAAVASGIEIPPGSASAVYAASTGSLSAQLAAARAPSSGPGTPRPGSRDEGLGSAATMDAASLSGAIAAQTGGHAAQTGGHAAAAAPRRTLPLVASGVLGAIVVGAVVFFVVRGQTRSAVHHPTMSPATPAAAGVVAEPDPATPVDREPAPVPGAVIDAAAAPVAPSKLVAIHIKGPPPDTEVYGPRGPLGVAPGTIQLDRNDVAVLLTFKHDGYQTQTATVMPMTDETIQVTLEKKKADRPDKPGRPGRPDRPRGKGTGRNTIEDPFK